MLTQPVIPVLLPDGSEKEVGIREALLRAHEWRDIRGDSPLERYALLRLLIAFAMDMQMLKNSDDRSALMEKGRFSPETFDAYISACEAEEPRFDLFDDRHPFLQSAYSRERDENALKPVANLFSCLPTGNNHVFWDHRMEDVHAVTPAQAFRGICATYLFCMAGAQDYPSSVNNTPPMYVVSIGENLFETIVMNMLSERECGNIVYGRGDVPWRNAEEVVPKKAYPTVTMLGALTWMPRRITLQPPKDGYIVQVYLQQGKNFKGNDLWKDPHVPFRKTKDGAYVSVKPELSKAFWRDIGTLIYDPDAVQSIQPLALKCLHHVVELTGQPVQLRAVGLVTNQASVVQWQEDELRIPSALLEDEGCAATLRQDVGKVELAKNMIDRAVRKGLYPRLAEESCSVFLQSMHRILFAEAMDQILHFEEAEDWDNARQEHDAWFDERVIGEMRKTLRKVIDVTGKDAKALMIHEEIKKNAIGGYRKLTKGGRT